MKRWTLVLMAVGALMLSACSFDPEGARIGESGEGWGFDDQDDSGVMRDAEAGSGEQDGSIVSDGGVSDPDGGIIDLDGGTVEPDGEDSEVGVGGTDVGEPDAGEPDAGEPDVGEPDAGEPDVGEPDAGEPDVGEPDAGEPDVGEPDSGTFEECNGVEVDLSIDDDHCGSCGNSCDSDFGGCESGECACSDGMVACGGENRCEDLDIDPNHCGACGNACGPGSACSDGECECRPGFTLCNGECVDTSRNPNHCGECNEECDSCRDGECSNGCGVTGWECQQPGDDGVTCMSVGSQNALYCDYSWGDACGTQCGGNQGCVVSVGCVDMRAGRGCDSCPCDDCDFNTEACRDSLSFAEGTYCLTRP